MDSHTDAPKGIRLYDQDKSIIISSQRYVLSLEDTCCWHHVTDTSQISFCFFCRSDEASPLVVTDMPVEFQDYADAFDQEIMTRWQYLPNFGQSRPDPQMPQRFATVLPLHFSTFFPGRLVGLTKEWQQQREVSNEELRMHTMTGGGSSWTIMDPVGGYWEDCVFLIFINETLQAANIS